MTKLTPYMAIALASLLAIVGVQQYRIKSKSKEITLLEVRIESIKGANTASIETIRELQAVNEQCSRQFANSKIASVKSKKELSGNILKIKKKLEKTKNEISNLNKKSCANQLIGSSFKLFSE